MQALAPDVDHNPLLASADTVLAALRGTSGVRRWSFRYELLDDTNTKVEDLDNVESASVEQNWLADIKRTATFHLHEVQYIDYLSDRIKPWARLALPPFGTDDWVEWPLGVFVLSTPTRSITEVGHVHRDVSGYDLLQVLADNKVPDRYTVTAGTPYTTAVAALIDGTTDIETSTLAAPTDIEWEPGTSKLRIVNDLLDPINYESVSVDEHGTYTVRSYRTPSERGPEYTYADDTDGLIVPRPDQTLDLFSIPNRWVRAVSQPDRAVLVSTVTNDDPASLTSTVHRGRTITDFATVQDVPDQATLDALTERVAFASSQVYEAIEFETAFMPIHSGNDVYRLTYRDLSIDAVYGEHKWACDLQAGATMTHRARRVVSLAV